MAAGPRATVPASAKSGRADRASRGLLGHRVRGVPAGPVLVWLPGAFVVLAYAASARRCALARSAVDADAVSDAGAPRGDLLDQPHIAVGISERAERPVAGVLGVRAGLPCLDRERRAVPDVAGVDAMAGEFVMGRHDVGDDQPPLGRAWRRRRESQAERDRGGGARGRELDDAKAGQRGVVGVEPPAQALVELLGSVDIGYGDDIDLEVHVDHVCLLERFLKLAGDFVGCGPRQHASRLWPDPLPHRSLGEIWLDVQKSPPAGPAWQ